MIKHQIILYLLRKEREWSDNLSLQHCRSVLVVVLVNRNSSEELHYKMEHRIAEEILSLFPIRKHPDSSNFPLEAAKSAGKRRNRFATTRKYLRKLRNVNEYMNKIAHK